MPSSTYKREELDPSLYTVAWIAPLEIETRAAILMLDVEHTGQFPDDGGDYTYIAGEMCGHSVIIATFPAGQQYGTGSAAALASHIKTAFRNIRIGLLVGVAAGIPRLSSSPPRDIRLGDILVALPDGEDAAVVAYDLGKETANGFEILRRGHAMDRTASKVASAIGVIKRKAPKESVYFGPFYDAMKDEEHDSGTFVDPGQELDLFHDDDGNVVTRAPRKADRRTRVWYGPIGSGDKLMKNAQLRDKLRANHNILGLEMEAAGTMNVLPVGVIRGVCDYADPDKNKQWQPYAAAMAAAYAKAILEKVPLPKREETTPQMASSQTAPHQAVVTADAGKGQEISSLGDTGSSNYINGANHGAVMNGVSGGTFNFGTKADVSALPQPVQDQLHLEACEHHLWSSVSQQKFANTRIFPSSDWIFRQDDFKQWQAPRQNGIDEESPTLLTIKGKAFTGKSSIMKTAVKASLKEKCVITLYHFFGGVSSDPTAELLRDLLGQLLVALPPDQKPFQDIRRWGSEIQKGRCVEFLSHDRLQEEFKRILLAVKSRLAFRIFVDAIDDCFGDYTSHATHYSDEDKRRPLQLLEVLANILDTADAAKMDLGICVSRRQQPEFPGAEPPATTISLVHYMDEVIKPFIQGKLESISDPTKVLNLLLKMSETGAHNFRWATAVCDEIMIYKDTVFEKLEEIASRVIEDHEAVYCRAIRSSKASSPRDYDRMLRFLLLALGTFRELTPEEFRHAYAAVSATDFGDLNIATWEKSDSGLSATHFAAFVSNTTGGLLETVSRKRRPRYTIKDAVDTDARVEHHVLFQQRSTESFLRSSKGLQELSIASASQLNLDCHCLLFRACGSVLEKCSLRDKDDIPMVDYACEYWLRHSRMCGEALPHELPGFMKKCTHPKAQLFIKKQIFKMRMKREHLYLEDQTSMMVLLAVLGCKELLCRHLDTCRACKSAIPDPSEGAPPSELFMMSLCSAIQTGKTDTAMYLLEFLPPGHVNKPAEDNCTLLYMACCSAHIAMPEDETGLELIKMLLERGANPCIVSAAEHELPLHFAIGEGNEQLIRVLCRGYQQQEPDNFVDLFEFLHEASGFPALHYALKCDRLRPEKRVAILGALCDVVPRDADLLLLEDRDERNVKEVAEEIGDYSIIDKLYEFDD